jgi:hypothetical protein
MDTLPSNDHGIATTPSDSERADGITDAPADSKRTSVELTRFVRKLKRTRLVLLDVTIIVLGVVVLAGILLILGTVWWVLMTPLHPS